MNEESDREPETRSHPPPPCDPFQRYQTPWPRHVQDDENPFIRFRRFADDQFRSFFSGVPFVKRSLDEHFENLAAQHRKEMDTAWKEIIENHQRLIQDMEQLRSHRDQDANTVEADPNHSRSQDSILAATPEHAPLSELDMYERSTSEDLDPFANQGDTFPWLLSSPYSPVWLSSSLKTRPETVLGSWEPGLCFAVYRSNTENEDKLQRLDWQSAFQDLLSLERTGDMAIDSQRRKYWSSPAHWLKNLSQKGLLTCRAEPTSHQTALVNTWSPIVSGQSAFWLDHQADGMSDQMSRWAKSRGRQRHEEGEDEDILYYDDIDDDADEEATREPSIMGTESEGKSLARTWAHAFETVEKTLEEVMRRGTSSPDKPESIQNTTNAQPSIISTMMRTETRTLPDGSIETRRVLRRRFANGNEELEETVDTEPPVKSYQPTVLNAAPGTDMPPPGNRPNDSTTAKPAKQPTSADQTMVRSGGGGWFWR
jgi:hypothetical protein